MLSSRLKTLLTPLESWSGLLRPCVSELVTLNQERHYRTWRTWPNDWIPFRWQKPDPQPGYFESGDRKEGLDVVDFDRLKPELENLEILKEAPELVRKLYTLRFARKREWKRLQVDEYERNLPIRRRLLDTNLYERKVIRLTITIRNLRDVIRNVAPGSARHKIFVSRAINKRYKFLCELYRMDREQCEMLCEKLEIDFKPPIPYHWPYPFPERKRTIRETCENYCKSMKQKKLDDFKAKLDQEKVKFAEEKTQKLEWIEKTMSEFKITEDMLTEKPPSLHIAASYVYLE